MLFELDFSVKFPLLHLLHILSDLKILFQVIDVKNICLANLLMRKSSKRLSIKLIQYYISALYIVL